jgi:predicted MFS family arabinose efflux permease
MSRLQLGVCGSAFVVVAFAYALPPLLPELAHEFTLTELQVGVLVAVYQIGQVVAAVPLALIATRVGPKWSLTSSLLMLCATSAAFGLSRNYAELLASRFAQGAASVLCWSAGMAWIVETGTRDRRGRNISTVTGAGAAGALVGPIFGALASGVGRPAAFIGLALLVLPLIFVAAGSPGPAPTTQNPSRTGSKHPSPWSSKTLPALWIVALPSMSLGALSVIGPLRLHQAGWGSAGIAATYLAAALAGIIARPLVGRYSDRRGRLRPILCILICACPVTIAIPYVGQSTLEAGLVSTAVLLFGTLWGPSMALLSDEWDAVGVKQLLGFALMYLVTAPAGVIGSIGAGALDQAVGDTAVMAGLVAILLISGIGIRRVLPRPQDTPQRLFA